MSQRGGIAARPCATMGGQCISAVDEPRKGPDCLIRLGYGEDPNNQKLRNALFNSCVPEMRFCISRPTVYVMDWADSRTNAVVAN